MRIKKLTAVLLCAVMAIGMCACTQEEKKPVFDKDLEKEFDEMFGEHFKKISR